MASVSNEFQDKRKIRSLDFCQSQSQPSKTCWMPASLRLQLGPVRVLKTWLYISVTFVWMLLAHLLEVPTELWDTKPGVPRLPQLPNAGRALRSQGGLRQAERLREATTPGRAAHGAGWDLCFWVEAWCSCAISLRPAWGLQLGVGRHPRYLKKPFKQYIPHLQLFLYELEESKKEWVCRGSSQRICQPLGYNLACRFRTTF